MKGAMAHFNMFVLPRIPGAAPAYIQSLCAVLMFVEGNPKGSFVDAAKRLGALPDDANLKKCMYLLKKYGFVELDKEKQTYAFDMRRARAFETDVAQNARIYSEWAALGDARCFTNGCTRWLKPAVDARGPYFDESGEARMKCVECDTNLIKASNKIGNNIITMLLG